MLFRGLCCNQHGPGNRIQFLKQCVWLTEPEPVVCHGGCPPAARYHQPVKSMEANMKEMTAVIVVLILCAVVAVASLPNYPSREEAQKSILAEHPECQDQLKVTHISVVIPSFGGPYATMSTLYYLECPIAKIKVQIDSE